MAKLTITQIDDTTFWILITGSSFPIFTAKSYVGSLEYTKEYYAVLRDWCCTICKCRYSPIVLSSMAKEAANKIVQKYKVEYEDGLIVLTEADGKRTSIIVQDQPYNTAESMFDLLTR